MASILIISKQGDGVPVGLILAREGHLVKMTIQDKKARASLEGFKNPSVIDSPGPLERFDLVLSDMVGLGLVLDKVKEKGRPVLGGGLIHDKLELDRDYGEKVCKKLTKLNTLGGEKITSKEKLISTLESSSEPKVVKPLGNKITTLTLVSQDPLNRPLISIAKNLGEELVPCLVQDKVSGTEISTEGWFNGKSFTCFNHTIEHKRLLEGDHGPQTGCMGNTVWVCKEDELVKQALLPLEAFLQRAKYIGPLDVNCIVTEKEVYFLEYTTRFGYDAIQALSELVRGQLFDLLWKTAVQEEPPSFKDEYSMAVRLSMPPYPNEGAEKLKGVQVLDIQEPARRHMHLSDVRLTDGVETLAGIDGVIGCATARGATIQECRRRVYRTVKECVIHQDVQFRKDIGVGVEESVGKLKTWGWLDA